MNNNDESFGGNVNADQDTIEGLEDGAMASAPHDETSEITEDQALVQAMAGDGDAPIAEETEPGANQEELAAITGADSLPETLEAPATVSIEEKPTPPAYEAFIAAVEAHAQALGLAVKEQKGFYQFGAAKTGHRLYVAKQGRGVTRIDTTLPRAALVVNGKDISLPLAKPNGRVSCHIDPSVESVSAALEVLASFEGKIEPPRKPTPRAA